MFLLKDKRDENSHLTENRFMSEFIPLSYFPQAAPNRNVWVSFFPFLSPTCHMHVGSCSYAFNLRPDMRTCGTTKPTKNRNPRIGCRNHRGLENSVIATVRTCRTSHWSVGGSSLNQTQIHGHTFPISV